MTPVACPAVGSLATKLGVTKIWGDLTDNDVEKAAGRRSRLVGIIQEKHGKSHAEAWRELNRVIGKVF